MEYKHWIEIIEEGITGREALLPKLDAIATIDNSNNGGFSLVGADNLLLYPNIRLIKELNTSFVDLMKIDYQYRSKRIVPIMIIRSLIEISVTFYAYTIDPDKALFLQKYHNGTRVTKMKIDGKYHSVNKLVEALDKKYSGYSALYDYCCKYVHSGYDYNKSATVWHEEIRTGRTGFCGKRYKLKERDFENELLDGTLDAPIYDYEEECDIADACIMVNGVLTDLINAIRSEE